MSGISLPFDYYGNVCGHISFFKMEKGSGIELMYADSLYCCQGLFRNYVLTANQFPRQIELNIISKSKFGFEMKCSFYISLEKCQK